MDGHRHAVTSADGTEIGLLTAADGPPLLLVHGGMGDPRAALIEAGQPGLGARHNGGTGHRPGAQDPGRAGRPGS
jgi:hypothetical protein